MRRVEARRRARRGEAIPLAELAGDGWFGWTLAQGRLYHPTWRNGFIGDELAALWYHCQAVRELERQVRELRCEAAQCQEALQVAEQRAWWYRHQLVLEARLGMMLARLYDGSALS